MRVLVIGCGRVGAGLARTLALRGHDDVVVIDRDPEAFETLGPAFPGRTVVGDGLDRRVLVRAGIERTDGLAAVAGSDEVNAVLGRLATRVFGVPRVVARMYDPRQAEIYRRLGVRTISPVRWGIARMTELLSLSELEPVASLGAGEVEIVDAMVPALLDGRPLSELVVAGETQVAAITRRGRTFVPASSATVLEAGDTVHVAVLQASAGRLEALLGRHSAGTGTEGRRGR